MAELVLKMDETYWQPRMGKSKRSLCVPYPLVHYSNNLS